VDMIFWCIYTHIKFEYFISHLMITHLFFVLSFAHIHVHRSSIY
jgi:hypothetical protein